MTRVLITGSSGFVGSAICEALAGQGVETVGYDLAASRFTSAPWFDKVSFVTGNICDGDALEAALADHAVTHIVHAAALTPDEERELMRPDRIAEVNLVGSCRLAMAVAARRPNCQILHLSSIAVYGSSAPDIHGRFDEEATRPQPSALYGVTKFAAEMAMCRLADLHRLDLQIVRLGPLFGPWEHASGVRDTLSPHHQIARAARSGAPCVLPRNVAADWFYSRDAARKIATLLLTQRSSHRLLNLGCGQISTLTDWCEALRAFIPDFRWTTDTKTPTIRYGYGKDRPALGTARLDAVIPPGTRSLREAASDYLSWLDVYGPCIEERRT